MECLRLRIRNSTIWELLAIAAIIGVFVFLITIAIVFPDDFGPLILLPVYGVAPYLIIAALIRGARRRRVGTILAHIEEAVRMNMPLADMALSAADSESGKTRQRLLQLHSNLKIGMPLALALFNAVPELPAATVRAIDAGEQIGQLPRELDRLVKRYLPSDRFSPDLDRFYRGYAIFVSVFMVFLVCGMISIFVMPKYQSILTSFGRPMPWITQMVISSVNGEVAIVLALVALLVCIPWRGAARDYLLWHVPVAGGAARDRGLADLFAFLSDAMEAGVPMHKALFSAQEEQSNAVLRARIGKWRHYIELGAPIDKAARMSRMPALVASMMRSTNNGEGFAQVMRFLARHYEYRFSRFREVLRAAAIPAFVAVMGAVVLAVQLSIFRPLISLIDVISSSGSHHGSF